MASILDRYGIKEVADVTFYNINDDGSRGNPVLYLDTLKVSTIEQTAETSDARGGKGNPKLITWDYGKDITVTLEDALFSPKSLAIMFGDGNVTVDNNKVVTKTAVVRAKEGGVIDAFTADVYDSVAKKVLRKEISIVTVPGEGDAPATYTADNGRISIKTFVNDKGETVSTFEAGEKYFITYEQTVESKKEIIVSADTFPGTYYVTGDTYARSDINGEDQFFQFIIQKAKVTSENTITLEAEGDPSVFNMNLSVLRPENGEMMRLVQYTLEEVEDEVEKEDEDEGIKE